MRIRGFTWVLTVLFVVFVALVAFAVASEAFAQSGRGTAYAATRREHPMIVTTSFMAGVCAEVFQNRNAPWRRTGREKLSTDRRGALGLFLGRQAAGRWVGGWGGPQKTGPETPRFFCATIRLDDRRADQGLLPRLIGFSFDPRSRQKGSRCETCRTLGQFRAAACGACMTTNTPRAPPGAGHSLQ